ADRGPPLHVGGPRHAGGARGPPTAGADDDMREEMVRRAWEGDDRERQREREPVDPGAGPGGGPATDEPGLVAEPAGSPGAAPTLAPRRPARGLLRLRGGGRGPRRPGPRRREV